MFRFPSVWSDASGFPGIIWQLCGFVCPKPSCQSADIVNPNHRDSYKVGNTLARTALVGLQCNCGGSRGCRLLAVYVAPTFCYGGGLHVPAPSPFSRGIEWEKNSNYLDLVAGMLPVDTCEGALSDEQLQCCRISSLHIRPATQAASMQIRNQKTKLLLQIQEPVENRVHAHGHMGSQPCTTTGLLIILHRGLFSPASSPTIYTYGLSAALRTSRSAAVLPYIHTEAEGGWSMQGITPTLT